MAIIFNYQRIYTESEIKRVAHKVEHHIDDGKEYLIAQNDDNKEYWFVQMDNGSGWRLDHSWTSFWLSK